MSEYSKKEFKVAYLKADSTDSVRDHTKDGPGLSARAHDIMAACDDLEAVTRVLHQVNMDRLATHVEYAMMTIRVLAAQIPAIVNSELDKNIAHGKTMMGGLLGVAMRMGELTTENDALKAGKDAQ